MIRPPRGRLHSQGIALALSPLLSFNLFGGALLFFGDALGLFALGLGVFHGGDFELVGATGTRGKRGGELVVETLDGLVRDETSGGGDALEALCGARDNAESAGGFVRVEEVGVGVLGGVVGVLVLWIRTQRLRREIVEVGGGGDLEGEGAVGPADDARVGLERVLGCWVAPCADRGCGGGVGGDGAVGWERGEREGVRFEKDGFEGEEGGELEQVEVGVAAAGFGAGVVREIDFDEGFGGARRGGGGSAREFAVG